MEAFSYDPLVILPSKDFTPEQNRDAGIRFVVYGTAISYYLFKNIRLVYLGAIILFILLNSKPSGYEVPVLVTKQQEILTDRQFIQPTQYDPSAHIQSAFPKMHADKGNPGRTTGDPMFRGTGSRTINP